VPDWGWHGGGGATSAYSRGDRHLNNEVLVALGGGRAPARAAHAPSHPPPERVGGASCGYEADGKTPARIDVDGGYLARNMTYDPLGEMLTYSQQTTQIAYAYDAFGLPWRVAEGGGGTLTTLPSEGYGRAAEGGGETATTLLYEGYDRAAECTSEGGPWALADFFTAGPTGTLYQGHISGSQTTHRYFHGDALGSVWSVTNSAGNQTGYANYQAFGNVQSSSGMSGVNRRFGGMAG
jgi:YD repeat-containing protein